MKNEAKSLSVKTKLFVVGGAIASATWAVTLYWTLVANEVIETPWVL